MRPSSGPSIWAALLHARSSGQASNATARSPASAWSSSSQPSQCRRMVPRHAPHSSPNHLAATAPSVYLHTTESRPNIVSPLHVLAITHYTKEQASTASQ